MNKNLVADLALPLEVRADDALYPDVSDDDVDERHDLCEGEGCESKKLGPRRFWGGWYHEGTCYNQSGYPAASHHAQHLKQQTNCLDFLLALKFNVLARPDIISNSVTIACTTYLTYKCTRS